MKDHIVRVANEAEFILNRMRADDVLKHAGLYLFQPKYLIENENYFKKWLKSIFHLEI